MIFRIKRHSDSAHEEQREIKSLEELLALMDEFKYELILCPNSLFSKEPVIWICDSCGE